MDFKATILNEADINRTLVRMSHQIIERNHGTDDLCLIGIRTRGLPLAERIAVNIERICGERVPVGEIDITLYRDDLTETAAVPVIKESSIPFSVVNKTVVLVDDVIFTCRFRIFHVVDRSPLKLPFAFTVSVYVPACVAFSPASV